MEWTEIIISLITLVLAPCMIILVNAGVKYLASKTDNEKLEHMLTDIGSAVATAVDAVTQTFVADLKDATKNGSWSKDEQIQALDKARTIVENQLSASTITFLSEHNIDIQAYLKAQIEAYIQRGKAV